MEKLRQNESVVFYEWNEKNDSHSISTKYVAIGWSKNNSLIIKRNYLNPEHTKEAKKLYVNDSFLNTTSEYWQETSNKSKYLIRIE